MTLYAYCVRRAGDPAPGPGLQGVDGGEVFAREWGGLAVWLSRVEAPLSPTRERVQAHDHVVRAALRTETPLPLRFGAAFPDEAAALEAVGARSEELLASLERVRGRVEMALTVAWDPAAERERLLEERPDLRPPGGRPATGRAYLEARRRGHALEAALRTRAEEVVADAARRVAAGGVRFDEVRALLPRPEIAGALAHLVHRDQMFTYREAVERAARELASVELRVSGPWAPYSFG